MSDKITKYLDRLEEVGNAATKGPWFCDSLGIWCDKQPDGRFWVVADDGPMVNDNDGLFIEKSRNEWERLIKMNRILLEACEMVANNMAPDISEISRRITSGAIEDCENLLEE